VNERPALLWRLRPLRLAVAALPLWFTVAIIIFNTPWRMKLLIASIFVLSWVSPYRGLIAVAALAPLGHLVVASLRLYQYRLTEAFVLAFFAGWLIRDRDDRPGPRTPASIAWSVAAIVITSIAAQLMRLTQYPNELQRSLQMIYQAYYLVPEKAGFAAGAGLIEGVGLIAATVTLLRAKPRLATILPAVTVGAAAVAALSSLLLVWGVAPELILTEHARLGTARTSAHISDVNASAIYFGMTALVALGLAARRLSTASVLWVALAAFELWAMWITGSRTGVAATVIVAAAAAACMVTARWRPAARRAIMVAVAASGILVAAGRARMLYGDPATSYRRDFLATSLRMIAARPVTGVGIGQYYDTSSMFLSPFLSWVYGVENAHNYFLQVAAELGLVGFAAFVALLAAALWRGTAAYWRVPSDARLLGLLAGAIALLATCLAQHPLLVEEVAFPFWMVLGLIAGLGESTLMAERRQADSSHQTAGRLRPAVVTAWLILVVVFMLESRRPITPAYSRSATGLEPWEVDDEGTRFQWTSEYASIFVPARATRVYIPVRQPIDVPRVGPIAVDVRVAALDRGRTIVGSSWAILNLELPPFELMQRYRRIDLRVDRTWQPAIYVPGSSDLRKVGVQVGEVKTSFDVP
jgi:O-antigen ligase